MTNVLTDALMILPADKGKAMVDLVVKHNLVHLWWHHYGTEIWNSYGQPGIHWSSECRGHRKHKLTYEESNSMIPFLDLLIKRLPISIQVYQKPTHTDQYLHLKSHHSITHKTSVVRTLMDRKNILVYMENDKNTEELHITTVLNK